jgi:hypothetical protein
VSEVKTAEFEVVDLTIPDRTLTTGETAEVSDAFRKAHLEGYNVCRILRGEAEFTVLFEKPKA